MVWRSNDGRLALLMWRVKPGVCALATQANSSRSVASFVCFVEGKLNCKASAFSDAAFERDRSLFSLDKSGDDIKTNSATGSEIRFAGGGKSRKKYQIEPLRTRQFRIRFYKTEFYRLAHNLF